MNNGLGREALANHATPLLSEEVRAGHEENIIFLLEGGASIEIKDARGRTPLHCAAFAGHETISALLLDRGASPSIKNNRGMTPLHEAAGELNEKVVQQLLDKDRSIINTPDN